MVSDSFIRFNVPEYSETDVECGPVISIQIYEQDCQTLSTAFKNADDAISTLSNGFYHLSLLDELTPKTYDFCLGVTT